MSQDERHFRTIGVLPLRSTFPCFATPVFSTRTTNGAWYQLIKDGQIAEFGEVEEVLLARIVDAGPTLVRTVGSAALYSYVLSSGETKIAEKEHLGRTMREEFDRIRRPYLRHTIAIFVGDKVLIDRAAKSIAILERPHVTQRTQLPIITFGAVRTGNTTIPRASQFKFLPFKGLSDSYGLKPRSGNRSLVYWS